MGRLIQFPWFLLLALALWANGFARWPKLETVLKDLERKCQLCGCLLVQRGGKVVFRSACVQHAQVGTIPLLAILRSNRQLQPLACCPRRH